MTLDQVVYKNVGRDEELKGEFMCLIIIIIIVKWGGLEVKFQRTKLSK